MVAVTTATLFLNFTFCYFHGLDLWAFDGLPLDAAVVAVAVLLITSLFFIGPAFAVQRARRPLFNVVENSLGSIPTLLVRLACVTFLVTWISRMIPLPTVRAFEDLTDRPGLESLLQGFIAAGLLAFLFLTALPSARTNAKLAFFTDKLGLAILVAAAIRVRDGWVAVPNGFQSAGHHPPAVYFSAGISSLGSYAAPLGLIAAGLAFGLRKRRDVVLALATGVSLPLFVALLVSGVVGVATFASRFYQPSLSPTIGMALFAHAARSAAGPRMFIAGVTTFGAARFGARSLAQFGPAVSGQRMRLLFLASAVAIIAILSITPFNPLLLAVYNISGKCLAVVAAVLAADWVSGKMPHPRKRAFDLIGLTALLIGLTTAICLPSEQVWAENKWWLPWLLPSYLITFATCVLGRIIQIQIRVWRGRTGAVG